MIVSELDWSDKTISNTSFGGKEAFTMASRTNKVTGDEAGSKGGVKSGVNKGWCRPKSNKTSFTVKGQEVIQHDNVYEMNCNGPDGPSNTPSGNFGANPYHVVEGHEPDPETDYQHDLKLIRHHYRALKEIIADIENFK